MPTTDRDHPLLVEVRRSEMFEPGRPVLVGFSGGPDSTALLLALHEDGHEVVAAHYDHALQPGSEMVAQHAARLCASLGIELISDRRASPLPKGSVQAGARTLRYRFLETAADQVGAGTIALGHTADDLVEGSILHLLRGCGIAGLRGMPARRGRFVRPLLNVWRRDVVGYLADRSITALEDPANSNLRFARVRVRRQLLPAFERDRPGITRRFHAAALRAAAMQAEAERGAGAAMGTTRPPVATIRSMREPLAMEALRLMYARAAGSQPALDRHHLEAMLRLVKGGPGGRGVDLPRGYRFRVVDSRAEVVPRVSPSMEASLEVKPCAGCAQPGAAHLRAGLDLRIGFRRPGLRMRPAGGSGTRKLQDIFVDGHVPREDRDTWPLVFAGDRLAWVPGITVDADFRSRPGEPSLHVTVTRILSKGRRKTPC